MSKVVSSLNSPGLKRQPHDFSALGGFLIKTQDRNVKVVLTHVVITAHSVTLIFIGAFVDIGE